MARANAAYYASRDPFRDFITAPEISQVFGELLGAWAAVAWNAMGSPARVLLAEAGPGRGTLMSDALRLARRVSPSFAAAARVHLVETSLRLRQAQAAALAGLLADPPCWHDRIDALPDGPLLLFGNEFLDALPVRQLLRRPGGWDERFVLNGRFVLRDGPVPPAPLLGRAVAPGEVLEWNPDAMDAVRHLAGRIVRDGGAALLLDYGPDRPGHGDTLQALRDGKPCDPLDGPGTADLTAHVDFPALAGVAAEAGARVQGPVGQGAFLSSLGLWPRTEQLARQQPPEQARALVDAAHRLSAPDRMGRLFKVMAVRDPRLPPLPGFEA
ncbi:class I SAM-dependent methyltransferase [Rhizosaccharibacter radicis]|uniref:SAM-dependent methyltransferase n=1 Tax=Rhizosaccharibacter radicis TaxID=2782605 RepID=A0ABT1W281_9PROT|nr:SAM-dependent methyltransferase [Acetobacteraceae bacterium KSS12]